MDETVDWTQYWRCGLDYKSKTGFVEGATRQACLARISGISLDNDFQIDMLSLEHSELQEFQAKYYKSLPGGYRINFRLKK